MRRTPILVALMCFVGVGMVEAGMLSVETSFCEPWDGVLLTWVKASYTGQNAAGTGMAAIPFGLTLPAGYDPRVPQTYPLILYLHGAGARGDNNANLKRQTPRFFAHQAQTVPAYNAFVLSTHVPSAQRYVAVDWDHGPYQQEPGTLTDALHLTEQLVRDLLDAANNPMLHAVLGVHANTIDATRLYIVGDSMGAYGVWDTVGRNPGFYAAAIAACGSGPGNQIEALRQTPFWAIHGRSDGTVPNALPTGTDPDGAGSLGMLALIDPTFDSTASTALIRLDDYASVADDPLDWGRFVYTEYPDHFGHSTVAMEWTARTSGVSAWLFAQQVPEASSLLLLAVGVVAVKGRPNRK